ncbi:MAG: hypothetical protein ABI422_07090 [Sphingomicrobium sp.]
MRPRPGDLKRKADMPFTRPCALALILAISGCATPSVRAPSLAPRAAEAVDPRVPVVNSVVPQPVDPALAARLAGLIGQARNGEGAFVVAAGEAQRLAATAGASQTEGWIIAQQALSAAVAARAPTTQALGDIDAMAADALARQGGIGLADLAAIDAAAAEVGAIDRRQAEAVANIANRLGS